MILPSSSKGLVSKETVAGEFHSRVAAILVCPGEISSSAFKSYIPGQPQPQLIRDIHSSEVAPNHQGASSIHWHLSKGFLISVEVWMGCRSGLPSLLNPCFLVMPSVMPGDFSSPGTLETSTTVPHSTNPARPMSLLCVFPIGAYLPAITVATIQMSLSR